MPASAEMIWDSALSLLRRRVAAETGNLWFQPVRATDLTHDCITLEVADEFSSAWLAERHLGVLREVLSQAAHRPLEVRFQVGAGGVLNGLPASAGTPGNSEAERPGAGTPASPRTGGFTSSYRFDSFVVGAGNDFAHAAALAAARTPGRTYNPLFLYGGVGLGKTHLLHAISGHLADNNKRARVMYRSSEEFTNQYIESLQKNELTRFRNTCRQADVLLIDDVQFLAGKERIQEEFFHTFNALYDADKQIVLTCDRPAAELLNLQRRLLSRFEGGLVAGLDSPDLETREAILHKKQESLGIKLPEEIIQFIAGCIRTNVRRLEGALVRVASYARLIGQQLTVQAVEGLLSDLWYEKGRSPISIESIQDTVARRFDLRRAELTGKRRPERIAFPRQIAMCLARKLTDCSLSIIGEAFGGRDHGTVLHACRVIKDRMEVDARVREVVLGLEKLCLR